MDGRIELARWMDDDDTRPSHSKHSSRLFKEENNSVSQISEYIKIIISGVYTACHSRQDFSFSLSVILLFNEGIAARHMMNVSYSLSPLLF